MAASAAKPAAQKSSKDTLTIAYCCVQSTLDPHFAATTADALFMRNIHNALVKCRGQTPSRSSPDLATSWEMSPDGLQYTFKLRTDVEWHKGTASSRNDVKASFERLLSPEPSRRSPPA